MSEAFIGGHRVISTGEQAVAGYVWDTGTLTWVASTASSGGASGNVNVTNTSLAVTQAGAWNINAITTLPAITGTVSVSNFPATQPVSIASMPSTPVTGTFWQATQPVSLASTTITGSVAVTGPLTDTQLRASAVPVSLTSTTITGTVAATQSGTWNVGSITTLPALPTGANTIGSVNVNGTVPVSIASMPSTPVTGTFWQATQPVSLASTTITNFPGTQAVSGTVTIANAATVDSQGQVSERNRALEDLMVQVLVELRIHSAILHSTLNSRDDLDALRQELANGASQTTS